MPTYQLMVRCSKVFCKRREIKSAWQRAAMSLAKNILSIGEAGAGKSLESAGAMRQGGRAVGGNAVFLCPVISPKSPRKIFWQKNRIVAKPKVAARRENKLTKNLALKALHLSVRKGEGEGAHEMGLERRAGSAACKACSTFFMAVPKSLAAPAQRAEYMPGAPLSAATQRPELSASAGILACSAAAQAFITALETKLAPVSSGSGRPSSAAEIATTPKARGVPASPRASPHYGSRGRAFL